MKKALLLLMIVPMIGFGQEIYNYDQVIYTDDPYLAYIKSSKELLTGIVLENEKYSSTENYYKEGKIYKVKYYSIKKRKKILDFVENYKDGSLHGESLFYEYNHVSSRENYQNGVQDGLQTFYYDNSELKLEEYSYINGVIEQEREWNEVGTLIFESNYKNGYLSGITSAWYDNGQLRYERNFNGGRVAGSLQRWYNNGDVMHDMVFDNGTGVDREYSIPGNLYAETSFKDGLIDGKQVINLVYSKYEAEWKNGELNGNFTIWNSQGKKVYKESEGSYKSSALHGKCKQWYPNDQLYKEYNFVNGDVDGMCKVWYKTGELKEEHLFDKGAYNTSKYFYVDGTLHYEIDYTKFNQENEFLKIIKIYYDNGGKSHILLTKGKRYRKTVVESVQCWKKNGAEKRKCNDIEEIQETLDRFYRIANDKPGRVNLFNVFQFGRQ